MKETIILEKNKKNPPECFVCDKKMGVWIKKTIYYPRTATVPQELKLRVDALACPRCIDKI